MKKGLIAALLTVLCISLACATITSRASQQVRAELLNPKSVEPVKAAEFKQILAAHQGEVVLVNFWATWCKPCVREIPELVKLQQKYREQKFTVIAVSFDDLEDLDRKVRPFAQKNMPDFLHYLQNEDDPEKFVSPLDPSWSGIVPTNFIFDREGKIQATLLGGKSYEDFEKALVPLLEKK